MILEPRSLNEIKAVHPMPWTTRMTPQPGVLTVVDANGGTVPLPAMLKVLELVTSAWANAAAAAAPAPQPEPQGTPT